MEIVGKIATTKRKKKERKKTSCRSRNNCWGNTRREWLGLAMKIVGLIDLLLYIWFDFVHRYPELSAKIGRLMDDYVLALRSKDETPGLLLAMTREAEAAILDKYQADVASKQQGSYFYLLTIFCKFLFYEIVIVWKFDHFASWQFLKFGDFRNWKFLEFL